MPIEPVKIPQNVYVEDRIIGPVTLRQIIIILAGSGLSYAVWSMMQSAGYTSTVYSIVAWSPAVIAAAFAFVKINDISMFRMLLLLAERMEKPRIRKWSPRQGITINIVTSKLVTEEPARLPQKQLEEEKIATLSQMLDRGPEDDEQEPMETRTQETNEEPVEITPSSARSVDPRRVSVDTGGTRVDDITPEKRERPSLGDGLHGLLRDIHPPKA